MTTKFATNYPIPSPTNVFSTVWKLTRMMKAAGWLVLASSNGTTIDASGTQANDLWGGNADPTVDSYTSVSTTAAAGGVTLPQAAILVTSTVGFPASGTFSIATSLGWQTVAYTSTTGTAFQGCTGGTGTIANGNAIASGSTKIGMDQVAAWIVLSGPTTIKIPLSVNPTGTFLRNETVTQTSSGAEGEILGYVWDAVGSSGWAVIQPHTGTFDNVHTVTGATSGATLTPPGTATTTTNSGAVTLPQGTVTVGATTGFPTSGSFSIQTSLGWQTVAYTGMTGTTFTGCTGGTGAIVNGNLVANGASSQGTLLTTFVREFMFYKPVSDTIDGTIFYICGDKVGEITQLFSSLSGYTGYSAGGKASGVTSIVGPGCGGTNNSLTTISPKAICLRGTAGATTSAGWLGQTISFQNNAQIACVNATPATGVSADGSFYLAATNTAVTNTACVIMFTRLDDTEPGDCDPYIWLGMANSAGGHGPFASWNNTVTDGIINGGYVSLTNYVNNVVGVFFGYQSRGNPTTSRDTIVGFTGTLTYSTLANTFALLQGGISLPLRLSNTPATTKPFIRESFTLITNAPAGVLNSTTQIKGRTRWLTCFGVGNTYDTFDTKTWLGCSVASTGNPCICVGPYDGATVPVQ
jgi:hypothetical protein